MKTTFLFLLASLAMTSIYSQVLLDATVSINASNKLVITINSPASFEFNQTVTGGSGLSLIIDEVYAVDPPALTTTISSGSISYTATNSNSGSASQMGPFGFDFNQYTIRDEEITFPGLANSFTSGDIITIEAGTIISIASFNAPVPTINPGPYTAFIISDDYNSIAAPQIEAPLPVEISRFLGIKRSKDVYLEWETASEFNNEGFAVQHAPNGVDWQEIGFQPSAGNNNSSLLYSFIHDFPHSGQNYYRLKQIDFDGTSKYSEVIILSISDLDEQEIDFFPNPTSGVLRLSNIGQGSIRILDASGRILKEYTVPDQEIDISDLPSGILLIQAIKETQNTVKRIVKN